MVIYRKVSPILCYDLLISLRPEEEKKTSTSLFISKRKAEITQYQKKYKVSVQTENTMAPCLVGLAWLCWWPLSQGVALKVQITSVVLLSANQSTWMFFVTLCDTYRCLHCSCLVLNGSPLTILREKNKYFFSKKLKTLTVMLWWECSKINKMFVVINKLSWNTSFSAGISQFMPTEDPAYSFVPFSF